MSDTSAVLFYVYAAVAIAGAIGLVAARRLVHAVMSLFATLFAIAAVYLLLGSEFLAAMQLFVYGGAITVLVLFALMLTRYSEQHTQRPHSAVQLIALGLCLLFFAVLATTVGGAHFEVAPTSTTHDTASLASILFSRYVLPFEIAGLALTVALIGAIVLAREDDVIEGVIDTAEKIPGVAAVHRKRSAEAGETA